jgi:hypothetical protein
VAEDLWLPGVEHYLIGPSLALTPVEVTPLHAMLAAIYQAVGGRPTYPGIVASGQLARGLDYLGFEAELFPACTSVFRLSQVGGWEAMSADGQTRGHLVVWAASFNQCIDLTVCHEPALVRASVGGEVLMLPAVLPMPRGREQLLYGAESVGAEAIGVDRPPFRITWKFFPEWGPRFDPLLAHHAVAIEHGGLSLAHVVVDLLSALAVHQDLRQLDELYPRFGSLLSGAVRLPELDDYSSHRELGADCPTELTEERRSSLGRW